MAKTKPAQAGPRTSGGRDFPLLLVLVFLAGAASLLYEVLWVRQLGLSLGSTAIASSVMLSAFLGGLALGSWYAGRWADRLSSPLMTLAQLEIGAAVVGALSVPALAYAGRAYVLIASATGDNSYASLVLRAAFSLVVMLVPATIFGATFPLATAAAGSMVGIEVAAGGVSAASAFGSAAGAAAAGLFLEPAIGLIGLRARRCRHQRRCGAHRLRPQQAARGISRRSSRAPGRGRASRGRPDEVWARWGHRAASPSESRGIALLAVPLLVPTAVSKILFSSIQPLTLNLYVYPEGVRVHGPHGRRAHGMGASA